MGRDKCLSNDRRKIAPFVAGGAAVAMGIGLTIGGGFKLRKLAHSDRQDVLPLTPGRLVGLIAGSLATTPVAGSAVFAASLPEVVGCDP